MGKRRDNTGEHTAGPKAGGAEGERRQWPAYAGLAMLTAVLWRLTFPRFDLWPLAFVALAPLWVLVSRASGRQTALWAFLGGWAASAACVFWLRYTTWAGMIALSFYMALYWPAAACLVRWTRKRTALPFALLAPLVWVALEHLRSWLITGFPWYFAGHSQLPNLALAQIADVTGVYGISFLCVAASGLAADAIAGTFKASRKAAWACAGSLAGLLVAAHTYGAARIAQYDPAPGPTVLIVQGNVPQDLKHSPDPDAAILILEDHVRLSKTPAERVDMVVWPETMMPAPLNLVYEAWDGSGGGLAGEAVRRVAEATNAHLLIGSTAIEGLRERHYNSAYFISPDAELLGRYDKLRLVTFGEHTPFGQWFPILKRLRPPMLGPDLSPGRQRAAFDLPFGGTSARFGVTICYENAEVDLNRSYTADGVDFMVNLTNDGWFKDSSELDMHLAINAFRAIETRRSFARAANTGISAVIDPLGRVVSRIAENGVDRDIEGALVEEVPLSNLRSPYVVLGNAFAMLVNAGALAAVALAKFFRGAEL